MTIQAITTKYFGPTNTRGSRIKATAAAGVVYSDFDHLLDPEGNHAAAAMKLAAKYDWKGRWIQGGLPCGTGNVYVLDSDDRDSFTV